MEVEIPENISFATYHRFDYETPAENTVLGCFVFNPGFSYYGFHGMYVITEQPFDEGNAVTLAQQNVEERLEANIKPYYQIDSSTPTTRIRYSTQTYFDTDTTLRRLKVTYHFDFPLGTNLDEEQEKLEKRCQEHYQQHLASEKAEQELHDAAKEEQAKEQEQQ